MYSKDKIASEMGLPKDFLEELLKMFYDDIGDKISNLKNAINKNDLQIICEVSHALKGLAGNIRFDEIYTLTSKAESKARDKIEYDYDKYLDNLKSLVEQYKIAIQG